MDELLVEVPVVPDIKLAIEGVSLLCVFLLLEFKQGLTIVRANRTKFRLQVVEELEGYVSPQWEVFKEGMYLVDVSSILDHLYFRDIVRPGGVS